MDVEVLGGISKAGDLYDIIPRLKNTLEAEEKQVKSDDGSLVHENVSDEDFEDYVKAANQMLEKQGLKGLTMPHIITRQARIKKMKELISRKEKANE